MEVKETIPHEVAALIPCVQLLVTKKELRLFQGCIQRLEKALNLCPTIGATEGATEHPAIFHYFFGGTYKMTNVE